MKGESKGVLYATMLLLCFGALVALALGGLFFYHRDPNFYTAFQSRLDPDFYLSAALLLLISSLVYTPFSYGISFYFILSSRGRAHFLDLFFLFRRPIMLAKAIVLAILRKLLIYLERLLVLLLAALLEVGLFFCFLLLRGENLFGVKEDPFLLAAEFMLGSPALMSLSIVLWAAVLFLMLLSHLRYILCKYVLLSVPDAGVWQALRVGRMAIHGRLWYTLFFYLRYGALCILAPFTHGLQKSEPFSSYACRLAAKGWSEYCRRRSLR